jgi:hypothetical protein
MATTIKVADTANFVAPFLRYMPQSAGTNNEPLISSANMLMGIFLSPPFKWSWNRNTANFPTVVNQQDYPVALSDFGFLEKATVTDSSGNLMELTQKDLISEIGAVGGDPPGRPTFICVLQDDNAGNITFRLSSVPDAIYTIKLTYQKAPLLIASGNITFTSTTGAYSGSAIWAPIPDKYNFILQNGMTALMMAATSGDPRFQVFWSRFLAGIIGVAEGLDEMDKVLFLGNMLNFATQVTAAQMAVTQGRQAKAT